MTTSLSARQQIIIYSRNTAKMIRIALNSQDGRVLIDCADERMKHLWEMGCHSEHIKIADKETARRCVLALRAMI